MMNQKILYITSQLQYRLPEEILNKYEVKNVSFITPGLKDLIVNFKPQVIIFDEGVKIKLIKQIQQWFKFIPICVIGNFQDAKLLESILQLGVSTINLTQTDQEIESVINTLLWFSLSREEFWDEEYKLSRSEVFRTKIYAGLKVLILVMVLSIAFFLIPKIYTMITYSQPIYSEIELKYLTPSDICIVNGDRYIISDWSIRTLFEYNLINDEIAKTYTPEEQFNSVTINASGNVITSSIFSNRLFIYNYPDFTTVVSTVSLLRDNTILSVHLSSDNFLYVLDNKKTLYSFLFEQKNKFVLKSSMTIEAFFPIDVYTYSNYVFLLDNGNNVYKINKETGMIETKIILDKFFDVRNIQFTSFAISENWVYFVSEKTHKVYKLPAKLVI